MISGTYAWFLVGGFANLFDIGFDVIEAGAGLELRGDRSNAADAWKKQIERADFIDFSFIAEKGHYRPVSSVKGESFIAVSMEDDEFVCGGVPKNKESTDATAEEIYYNDFTFYVRSTGAELPGVGAYLTIDLSGKDIDDQGNAVEPTNGDADKVAKNAAGGASVAARVSVMFDNDPNTIILYAIDDEQTNAVTTTFSDGEIKDQDIADPNTGKGNQIIDSGDTGNAAAGLTPANPTALKDENGTLIKIPIENIPANSDTVGKQIRIRIWLEGNDKQCVDQGDNTIAGLNLTSQIKLSSAQ